MTYRNNIDCLPPGGIALPLCDVVAHCIPIRGSLVGARADRAESLEFVAEGKVGADIERQPLSAFNAVSERLKNGDVPSRVVIDFVGS